MNSYVFLIKGPAGPRGEKGEPGLGLFAPSLRKHSLHITANLRDNKILSCTYFGNPLPSISWIHNRNSSVIRETINQEKSEIKSRLEVKNITWKDHGKVKCVAKSVLGETEGSGYINVHSKLLDYLRILHT